MVTITELNRVLERFTDSPDGIDQELRMSLAQMVIQNLKRQGWTQRQLADRAGKAESVITRIVHGHQNCSFHTVGEILHALGVRASLIQTISETATISNSLRLTEHHTEDTYGTKEISQHEDSTQEGGIAFAETAVSGGGGQDIRVAQTG